MGGEGSEVRKGEGVRDWEIVLRVEKMMRDGR